MFPGGIVICYGKVIDLDQIVCDTIRMETLIRQNTHITEYVSENIARYLGTNRLLLEIITKQYRIGKKR